MQMNMEQHLPKFFYDKAKNITKKNMTMIF